MKAVDAKYADTLKTLDDEKRAADKTRQSAYNAQRAALDSNIAAARADYQAAVDEANAPTRTAVGADGKTYEAEDHSYLTAGADEAKAVAAATTSRGTFSAFEASRMGGGSPTDKIVAATARTAKAAEDAIPLAKKQLSLTQKLAMPVWGS